MTKGEIYLVVLSIQLFILVVIFFVVRVVLNPPKNIIKSFIIVDGNLYARCQQGHIALIKPPQPICIKDIVRIKLNQSISFNGRFPVVVETKDGKRVRNLLNHGHGCWLLVVDCWVMMIKCASEGTCLAVG